MPEKSNKLTVGLVKRELADFDQIVKPGTDSIALDGIGTFYKESSHSRPPNWISDFFGAKLGAGLGIFTASAKGLLLARASYDGDERVFAVIFGLGRHLLNEGALEERFGLRVVLNSVDPDSLRSIDKTALGSIPKQTREQISREGGAANFGIDIEQDLVSSVTGKSRVPLFGRTISGRDTFAASAKFDATNVTDFLSETLKQYRSEAYKDRFDWIDQIKDVRSKDVISYLNETLIEKLKAKELEGIWLAPPEVLEWSDVKGFRYLKKRSADVPDLDASELLVAAGDAEINMEWLKASHIILISAKSDDEVDRWSVYKCIYAEIEADGAMHVLNAGKWYKVSQDFTALVNQDFASIPDSAIELPDYTQGDEGSYNEEAAKHLAGACCMDEKLISHGGGHSKIEFCDILTPNKEFIHVKRYSGSQQMSHLFAQGAVSGELFLMDADFREKVNEKLPDEHKLADTAARPRPEDYEVVFTVISKSPNALNLPFFSKISLRNANRRLKAFGFRVSKKKVRAIGNAA